jgi:hypothetical protein
MAVHAHTMHSNLLRVFMWLMQLLPGSSSSWLSRAAAWHLGMTDAL